MNLMQRDGIEIISIQKAAQMGVSEFVRNFIGYAADRDPAPLMLILPNEKKGQEIVSDRIIPLLNDTQQLHRLFTVSKHDIKKSKVKLNNGMVIYLGYAGSPTSLKSHNIRYVLADETSDYPELSGSEADPISLALQRTRTYGRKKKVVLLSTPTNEHCQIVKYTEQAAVKLFYFVPCPKCGVYQRLLWGQLKFPHDKDKNRDQQAAEIEATKNVYYACSNCKAHISDTEKHVMVRAGAWATELTGINLKQGHGHVVTPDGRKVPCGDVVIDWGNEVKTVGMQISALYSLTEEWYRLASQWVKIQGNFLAMPAFYNQHLGEPWRSVVKAPKIEQLKKCIEPTRKLGELPTDTEIVGLTAGVDVQADRLYFVVLAHAKDTGTYLVNYGVLARDPAIGFNSLDAPLSASYGGRYLDGTFIDAGYHKETVENYCRETTKVYPIHGAGSAMAESVTAKAIDKDTDGIPLSASLMGYRLNSSLFKAELHDGIDIPHGKPGAIYFPSDVGTDYLRQYIGEERVETRKNGVLKVVWRITDTTAGNHYLDATVYAKACAKYPLGLHLIKSAPPPPKPMSQRKVVHRDLGSKQIIRK